MSIQDTLAKIAEQKWLIGNNIQGLPKPFIEEVVKVCAGCEFGEQRSRSMRQYLEHYVVPHVPKEDFLNQLKVTHFVCLKCIHQYCRALPYASIVFISVCHRGTTWMGKTHDYDPNDHKERQCSIAKHVGCKFVVKVICPHDASWHIEIWVNPNH